MQKEILRSREQSFRVTIPVGNTGANFTRSLNLDNTYDRVEGIKFTALDNSDPNFLINLEQGGVTIINNQPNKGLQHGLDVAPIARYVDVKFDITGTDATIQCTLLEDVATQFDHYVTLRLVKYKND